MNTENKKVIIYENKRDGMIRFSPFDKKKILYLPKMLNILALLNELLI